MNRFALPDSSEAGRLTLALMLALALHVGLLFSIPVDEFQRRHFSKPQLFELVLPAVERTPEPPPAAAEPVPEPEPPAAAPEPVIPQPRAPEAPSPPKSPPTERPVPASSQPVAVLRPTLKSPAPLKKPASVSKSTAPVKPTRPVKSPEKTALVKQIPKPVSRPAPEPGSKPADKSRAPVSLPPKPATLAARPPPDRTVARSQRREPRRDSASAAVPAQLNSAALLSQVARIETESEQQKSAGVRVQRVSLNQTGSAAGFYAADWARKVIRVGEMNFPDAARRLESSAGPLIDVAIRADGSLREVRILRSSGNAEIDRAARRIVELAAPYPPFPAELRQQADLLRIKSPWRFDPGGRIRAQ